MRRHVGILAVLAAMAVIGLAGCARWGATSGDAVGVHDTMSPPNSEPPGRVVAESHTTDTDPGAGGGTTEPDAPEIEAPRVVFNKVDPMPLEPSTDDVYGILVSMLGATDDVAAQARRVDPDFVGVPIPEGVEITRAEFTYKRGMFGIAMDGMPWLETTRVEFDSPLSASELDAAIRSSIEAEQPDWVPVRGVGPNPAQDLAQAWDLPEIGMPDGASQPYSGLQSYDLKISFAERFDGSSSARIELIRGSESGTGSSPIPDQWQSWYADLPVPRKFDVAIVSVGVDEHTVQFNMTAEITTPWSAYAAQYAKVLENLGMDVPDNIISIGGSKVHITGDHKFDWLFVEVDAGGFGTTFKLLAEFSVE